MHFVHFCFGVIASTAILASSLHHDVDHLRHVKGLVRARCDADPKSHGDLHHHHHHHHHHHSNTTHKHSCCAHGSATHGCGGRNVTNHPAETPTPTPKRGDGSTSQSDISTYLAAHNALRSPYSYPNLTWSDTLANVAQRWANNCIWEHSHGAYGENLAAGTGDFGIKPAMQLWVDEKKDYEPTNPQPSHYTQMVWKATTQLGCAVASCHLSIFPAEEGLANFYVCEYDSPGNVDGEYAENVPST